jgi:hypothetical protein
VHRIARTVFQFALATVGIAVVAWVLIGHPPIGRVLCRRVSIDIQSGDLKYETLVGNMTISRSIVETQFSRDVHRHIGPVGAPQWRPIAARYSPSGSRDDFALTGAADVCQELSDLLHASHLREDRVVAVIRDAITQLGNEDIKGLEASKDLVKP